MGMNSTGKGNVRSLHILGDVATMATVLDALAS